MNKPGPKRSIDVGDEVIVAKLGSTFFLKQGTVTEYIPATSTSWGSYVRVTFADGSTRRFRPAEVQEINERNANRQLRLSAVRRHGGPARPRTRD